MLCCYRCSIPLGGSYMHKTRFGKAICNSCMTMLQSNAGLIRPGGFYPECSNCGIEAAGWAYHGSQVLCQACNPLFGFVDKVQETLICEECKLSYEYGVRWFNTRLCVTCEDSIRKEIGVAPTDRGLTQADRDYLAETFGLEKFEDPDLVRDAPHCQSCLKHSNDRQNYPCLRESANDCGWARDRARSAGNFQQPYWRLNNSTISTTSNAVTYNWNGQAV